MNFLKRLLLGIALLMSAQAFAQHLDTVVNMGNYKSYYSYAVKNPLYVTYNLFKGGGPCDRTHFHFDPCGINTATANDYAHSGFEEGHLANAEDFAYDCVLDKKTFCFFNCVPQTRMLNRGIWKTWEGKLRDLSQRQHLFIIAGNIYGNKVIKPGSTVGVPDFCYKIVVNPANRKILYCLLFPNDNSDQVRPITLAALKQMLGYPLMP